MELTEAQLKQIEKAASDAAAAAIAAYGSTPNEHMKTLMDESKAQAESIKSLVALVKAGEAQVQVINGQLTKFAKANGQVSLIGDVGMNQKEVSQVRKNYMYRGILRGIWDGADFEKEVAVASRMKAIGAGEPTTGGYYIPTELSSSIVEMLRNADILAALGVLNINPMRQIFEIPTITQGTTASFVGENQALNLSDLKFGVISMSPKKLSCFAACSREMLDAADPAIVDILERDMVAEIMAKKMWAAFYGNNAANTPLGLANIADIQTYEVGATGDDPSKTVFRAIRAKVDQKHNDNPSFAFAMNNNVLLKAADLANTAAPDASYLLDDVTLVNKIAGAKVVTSGAIRADKTKTTTNCGDVFYGPWNQFVQAIWWGGLRLENTSEGGNAFAQDQVLFKAILPMNFGARRPKAFVHAKFMKSILSA